MTQQSPDDALQPKRDYFDPAQDEPHLPQDFDTPASPASDTGSKAIPADDPRTDSQIDAHELYDEGLTSAAQADTRHDDSDEHPKAHKLHSNLE
ncbi:MAG TPA: hypothetical protein VFT87_04925 [Candidatus Saccharimonadales bacterium]|nr:hypothetical protein [Candidatus Saccharimonadales bacterium]